MVKHTWNGLNKLKSIKSKFFYFLLFIRIHLFLLIPIIITIILLTLSGLFILVPLVLLTFLSSFLIYIPIVIIGNIREKERIINKGYYYKKAMEKQNEITNKN